MRGRYWSVTETVARARGTQLPALAEFRLVAKYAIKRKKRVEDSGDVCRESGTGIRRVGVTAGSPREVASKGRV